MSIVHVGQSPSDWEGWGESSIVHFHNFESLPTVQGNAVKSPSFKSFGNEWMLKTPSRWGQQSKGRKYLSLLDGLFKYNYFFGSVQYCDKYGSGGDVCNSRLNVQSAIRILLVSRRNPSGVGPIPHRAICS
jgi:hypothetical protein